MKKIFESERISFVEVSESLIDDYLELVNDEEHVGRFIGGGRHEPYTKEQEIEWVRSKLEDKTPVFSMIEKKSGEFIGNIEFMGVKDAEGELGIALTAKKQDLGFGSEAIPVFLGYGTETLGLKKVVLRTRPYNERAIHVYMKCGFCEYDRTDEHVFMIYKG